LTQYCGLLLIFVVAAMIIAIPYNWPYKSFIKEVPSEKQVSIIATIFN
jgi:hypothetical protein